MKSVPFFIFFCATFLFIQCGSDERTVGYVELPVHHEGTNEPQETDRILLQSGNYGNLQVAFNGAEVTGYYNMVTGNGQLGCNFYFIGKTEGKKGQFPIEWYFPGNNVQNTGTITIAEGKIELKVVGNPGGQCMPELTAAGESLSLHNANNWKSIRIINSSKAEIYEENDESMGTGLYYKKGDVLCVLEEKGEWLRTELVGKDKMGWVKAADLDM
jgi:hypothetical protein